MQNRFWKRSRDQRRQKIVFHTKKGENGEFSNEDADKRNEIAKQITFWLNCLHNS